MVFWVGFFPMDLLMHSDVITYAIFCVLGITSNEIFNHSTRKKLSFFLVQFSKHLSGRSNTQ